MVWIRRVIAVTILCVLHVEAVSLTCDDTTGVCPGTELTCTCTSGTIALVWQLPGGGSIDFVRSLGIGASETVGIFTAEITDTPVGGVVSKLRYNATQSVANSDIVCDDGGGSMNNSTITEFANPPSAPATVSVQSTTYNSATIQWTAPSDNGGSDITGYTITISPPPSGDSTCPLGSCTSDTVTYTVTELDHTINYNVSVGAMNCAGSSVSIDDLIDIVAEAPNAPPIVKITNMDDSSITVEWGCPTYNPLSLPVDNYTVTVNNNPVSVASDGSCSYMHTAAIAQDAPYSVSVVATNDVGDSDTVLVNDIMSLQVIFNVTATSTFNTITFTFNASTVDDATPVTITLSPNDEMGDGTIGDGTIGGGVVISGLMSDTPYTYNVSFVYNNITYIYTMQSSVTTLVAPTTLITTSTTTTSATPTPTTGATSSGISTTTIIIIVVVVVAVIALLLVTLLIVCICIKVKSRQSKGDDGVALRGEYRQKRDEPEAYLEKPVPETGQSGPMYQDPNTIERQQAPTGDFYAVPDRNKKSTVRRDPPAAPTELATYQDPSTIQHETAPTGDLYAIADKKPPAPKPDDRTYAALDFENGTGTASTSFQSRSRPQEVLYSEVQQ